MASDFVVDHVSIHRRRFLRGLPAVGTAALAGCSTPTEYAVRVESIETGAVFLGARFEDYSHDVGGIVRVHVAIDLTDAALDGGVDGLTIDRVDDDPEHPGGYVVGPEESEYWNAAEATVMGDSRPHRYCVTARSAGESVDAITFVVRPT